MTHQRAPFATRPDATRGRLYAEAESPTRSPFQRDRDRILHAGAFRRLKHKTQVFVAHVGDYYRTRLTHSLEVSQIARSLARELGLDEDLAETLALAHDLGHTPFGHAGEDALNEAMQAYDGFDHNAQSLRVVTHLERRYIGFDGLNLTWETLEGLVKHNGPLLAKGEPPDALPFAIRDYADWQNLALETHAGAEAQIAALADDIAYNNHDIDDGLRAGLFAFDDLRALPLLGDYLDEITRQHKDAAPRRLRHEMVRRMISAMVADVAGETRRRADSTKPQSVADVRALDAPLVAFSAEMEAHNKKIKEFLKHHMYRHHEVNRSMSKARRVVGDLFALFMDEPELLPRDWLEESNIALPLKDKTALARNICDYIAGMTDRFAMEEHRRLFDISDDLA